MLFSRDRATLLHVHGVSKCTNLGKGSCWGVDCKGKGPVPVFGDLSSYLGMCPLKHGAQGGSRGQG